MHNFLAGLEALILNLYACEQQSSWWYCIFVEARLSFRYLHNWSVSSVIVNVLQIFFGDSVPEDKGCHMSI